MKCVTCRKPGCLRRRRAGDPNSRERGELPQLALWREKRGAQGEQSLPETRQLFVGVVTAQEGE